MLISLGFGCPWALPLQSEPVFQCCTHHCYYRNSSLQRNKWLLMERFPMLFWHILQWECRSRLHASDLQNSSSVESLPSIRGLASPFGVCHHFLLVVADHKPMIRVKGFRRCLWYFPTCIGGLVIAIVSLLASLANSFHELILYAHILEVGIPNLQPLLFQRWSESSKDSSILKIMMMIGVIKKT